MTGPARFSKTPALGSSPPAPHRPVVRAPGMAYHAPAMDEHDRHDQDDPLDDAQDARHRQRRQLLMRALPYGLVLLALLAYTGVGGFGLAVGIVVMVLWHEYGHIRAARRVGVGSRGIFLIPFLGGVAALDSMGKTRGEQVQIALGGPLYGLHLCAGALVLGLLFDAGGLFRQALLLWAGVNLFNLLPIHPLDGGRVVHALAHTVHPFAGVIVAGLGAAVSAPLAFFLLINPFQPLITLVVLAVAVVGVLEFSREHKAYVRYREVLEGPPAEGGPLSAEDAALLRMFGTGRLSRRGAGLYLANYLALTLLYLFLVVVGWYSPALGPAVLGGIG